MSKYRALPALLLTLALALTGCGGPTVDSTAASAASIIIAPNTTIITDESGTSKTVAVTLGSKPSADVTIPVSSSDTTEGRADKTTLTFTSANWSTAQNLVLTGVPDGIDDGNQSYTIHLGPASSTDTYYRGKEKFIPASNTDVTSGKFVISTISGNTSESGTTATFTVRLGSAPTAVVTIPISSSRTGEGTVNPTSLTFSQANWQVAQTVTVTGVSDPASNQDEPYTITIGPSTSADTVYNNPAYIEHIDLLNLDVTSASFDITPLNLNTDEAGPPVTFQVRLGTAPTANVTIPVESSDLSEGTVTPANLIFTADNWNQYQPVTVTGVGDTLADGDMTYFIRLEVAVSLDTHYNGLDPADVTVVNADKKTGQVTISKNSVSTDDAGGSDSFTVQLASPPASDVTVHISSAKPDIATVSVPSVLFTPATWNIPQPITITGVVAGLDNGDQTFAVTVGPTSSTDNNYDTLDPSTVAGTNFDLVAAAGVIPAISAGRYHNLLLANDGSVWGWGQCGDGQLDAGPGSCPDTGAFILPQQLNISSTAAVSAGYEFTAILKRDGTVWTSGVNTSSQLGHGDAPHLAPVEGLTGVKTIAAGDFHVLALKNDGTVWAWGKGAAGQLGDGSTSNSQSPVHALGDLSAKTITAIASGQDHSLALDSSGTMYSWGSDSNDQLGAGSGNNSTASPTAIPTLSGVSLIGTGQLHSFAIGRVGGALDVYGWGYNNSYQLGTGAGVKATPTAVNTFSNTLLPSKIDGGVMHSLALVGTNVYAWGDNDKNLTADSWNNTGALGTGDTRDKLVPTLSFTGSNAIDVEAGYNYSLILESDGRLRSSGMNNAAQLGTNEIPVAVEWYTVTPLVVEDPGDPGPGQVLAFYAYRPILAGYPAAATTRTTATIQVCPTTLLAPADCGPITYYKYSTSDGSSWSDATPISIPIILTGLSGTVNLWVKGLRDANTEMQTDQSPVKVSWSVLAP